MCWPRLRLHNGQIIEVRAQIVSQDGSAQRPLYDWSDVAGALQLDQAQGNRWARWKREVGRVPQALRDRLWDAPRDGSHGVMVKLLDVRGIELLISLLIGPDARETFVERHGFVPNPDSAPEGAGTQGAGTATVLTLQPLETPNFSRFRT